MKHLLMVSIALFLIAVHPDAHGQNSLPANSLSIGDKMPDLTFKLVGRNEQASLADFQGKVILIEFWASWCSPCIQSMLHLKALQEQFGAELVIIAVSNEKVERIATFTGNTNFPFLFARESAALRDYFPHRLIPHTVVVSPHQEVAAITRPEALTEDVIAQLLRGESVKLPLKEDHPWDIRVDIFELNSSSQQSFQIQPARPEAPTYSRSYHQGPFKDRRRSFINFQIPMLYRDAFNTSVFRMEYPETETPETYCVDLLVPKAKESQMEEVLRDSLDAYFGWTTAWQPRETEVWVLSALPAGITLPVVDEPADCKASGDHFTSEGAALAAFADYLESFGIAGMPVVDETGSDQLYRFDFSFEPENPDSFFEALADMGLQVKKEKRTIEILVLGNPG